MTQGSNPYLLHFLHLQVGSLPQAQPGKSHRKGEYFTNLKTLWEQFFAHENKIKEFLL